MSTTTEQTYMFDTKRTVGPAAVGAREFGGRLVGGAGELLAHRGLD